MVKATLLLFIALLVGCSSEEMREGALHLRLDGIDADSPVGADAVVAAEAWNLACGRKIIVWENDGVPVRRVKSFPEGSPKDRRGLFTPAGYDAGGTRIEFMAIQSSAGRQSLFAHEFGHALGLDHNEGHSVMNEDTSLHLMPTSSDCDGVLYVGE